MAPCHLNLSRRLLVVIMMSQPLQQKQTQLVLFLKESSWGNIVKPLQIKTINFCYKRFVVFMVFLVISPLGYYFHVSLHALKVTNILILKSAPRDKE